MEKDLQTKKKLREVKLSECDGETLIEIDGISIPNVCGYKLVVDPQDPLVVHLTVEMEFFRSDMQESISFSSVF